MEFRILGPVEFWSAGNRCDLGSAKERCVIANLLLTPRAIVPVETLIDHIWGTDPPAKARTDLSAYVSRIRKRLLKSGASQVSIAKKADGYVLDTDLETVDLHLFRQRVRQARSLARGSHAEQAVVLFREAEALWAGSPLCGLHGDWITGMRQSLEEERRAALLERMQLELELGRHAEVVGELRRLAELFDLDETAIACEIKALYLSGRMADALAVYAQARRRLIEEQGAEPGLELVQLHQRILRRDPGLAVVHASVRSARAPVADTLPPGASEFIGRVEEIRRLSVDGGTEGIPLIKIIEGMPGIGKTALAIHVARSRAGQHCDGRLYLNFLGHVSGQVALPAAEAVRRLLQMAGVQAARIPSGFEERAALWRAEMARRRLTVVLDDVRDPVQIRHLLPEAGDCLILITSRRKIRGIPGARRLTLRALHSDEARGLFVRITGAERIGDPAAADEAVRLCAGLPLAIHVVAARLRQAPTLSLAEMVEDLSPVRGQPGHAVGAYRQLKQAFDLSYEALAPSQQRLFRRLGAYPCAEITLHTAAALDETPQHETEQALDGLLGHHLLEEAAPGRFRCHDMIRAYAISLAVREDSAERRKAVCRVLDYYLYTADRADRMRYPHRHRPPLPAQGRLTAIPPIETPETAHQWLEAEWRNIVEAARHAGEHEWQWHCASLAHVLAGSLDASGYWHDAVGLHEVALRACRELDDSREIARASLNLSHASQQTGRYEKASRHAHDATNIYRSLGDRRGEAEGLDRLGTIHDYSSKFLEALAYYQEAQGGYRDVGDRRGVADTLLHAGIVCWCLGRPREAITQVHEALDLYRLTGDRRGEAKALNNIGEIQRYRGFHRDAVQRYEESLAIFRKIGGRQNEAQLHHNMGIVYQYKGDTEKALSSYRSALATYRDIGDLRNQADLLNNIGVAYQSVERHEEALANHQRALEIAKAIGNRYEQVVAMRGAADARRGSGHYAEAVDRYHRVLKLARDVSDPYQEAKILNGIAEALLHVNGRDARIYWRQALDIFSRLGVPEAESVKLRLDATGADPS